MSHEIVVAAVGCLVEIALLAVALTWKLGSGAVVAGILLVLLWDRRGIELSMRCRWQQGGVVGRGWLDGCGGCRLHDERETHKQRVEQILLLL